MVDFAGDGSRGVKMNKGVSFFLGEGISSFDVSEFGGWELSKACFWFDLLFFDDFGFVFGLIGFFE